MHIDFNLNKIFTVSDFSRKKLEDITLHLCETRYITIGTTIKLAFVHSIKSLSGLQYHHELNVEEL